MFIKKFHSSTALGHDPASIGNQKLMKLICDMLIKGVVYPESNHKTPSPSFIDPQIVAFSMNVIVCSGLLPKIRDVSYGSNS